MYARVVRFTDVTPDRVDEIVKRVEESDGPPPGVPSVGMQFLVDESQGTAVFVGLFEDEEKMREGAAALEQMDASDTPGSRASVDMCEVKIERRM
jgi:hypothetical protein